MAKLLWEGPETRRVPRGGKAEERRAARAQEMSPACRAREKRRRKRKYQNHFRTAIDETQDLTSCRRRGGSNAKGGKARMAASEWANVRLAKAMWARARARKGACVQG